MKFLKKQLRRLRWIQWSVVIPVTLMVLGIAININTATQFLMQRSAKSSITPAVSISQRSSQALISPAPKTASTDNNRIFSYQEIQQVTAGKSKFGYFLYPEGNPNKMMVIGSYSQPKSQGFERLAPEAGLALIKLIDAARQEGVWIIPVAGFRSIADQEIVFKTQIQQKGSPEIAAKLSPPPGYNEHQTGYALDLADGHFPKQDLTLDFAKTDAFRWLNLHAMEFGFELSFPENNPQGVGYQPWHWRFVGSPEAQAIFRSSKRG